MHIICYTEIYSQFSLGNMSLCVYSMCVAMLVSYSVESNVCNIKDNIITGSCY